MKQQRHTTQSIKRVSDGDLSSRPTKRNTSSNSSSIFSPPSTPKISTRSAFHTKGKIITSFKSVFQSSRNSLLKSPVSDDDDASTAASTPWNSPPVTPDREVPGHMTYTPDTPRLIEIPDFRQLEKASEINYELSHLSLGQPPEQCHSIFNIPEIVSKILTFVDEYTSIPSEDTPVRRRPLSYQHALLIYRDESMAHRVWQQALDGSFDNNGNPVTSFKGSNTLYNCLLVNKLWNQITMEVASTKLFFSDANKWNKFVQKKSTSALTRKRSNTKLFIMHKLNKAEQRDVEIVAPSISGNLEWIEMYICPRVLPNITMFNGFGVKTLVIPGSRVVDDSFLRLVAQHCPQLETLDLRACGLVTDEGMMALLSRCTNLTTLNLGRHSQSSKITDLTLRAVAQYTKIETLGMAGCAITDRGLWEVALSCSRTLTRLSLNGCTQLTDESLPRILSQGFFHNLSVLEIRHILSLTNLKPLVLFQRLKHQQGSAVLIEGCEVLEYRMRTEEWKQDLRSSARIFNDIQSWCSDENDGDVPHRKLAST